MSTSPQNNPNDQEIDLSQLSKKIGSLMQSFIDWLFDGILFILRNKFIIGVLFVIGFALGLYKDEKIKIFNHQVIVTPNFGSTDYLYSKINLINAKIKEGDTLFLKQIGIKDTEKFGKIEIEPIVDVYRFISGNEQNFEMLKLMAEDGNLNKIVEDNLTSKNYTYHMITFSTKDTTSEAKTLKPLLDYLNHSDFYAKIQKESINNINVKIKENDSIISQINDVMNQFSKAVGSNQKSDKLVYYNENTQLNDVIKTKEALISEKGNKRLELVVSDRIIKDTSHTLNIENTKMVNGKMKLVLPFLFISLFVVFGLFRGVYKKQLAKRNLA